MTAKIKFIVCEGMDNAGKSTLLADLTRDFWPHVKEIKFPKTLPSGALLRFSSEKDFEMLFSMFKLLDSSKTYLLDRFIVSNLVYDKVLRGEDTAMSKFYYEEFKRQFKVLEIFLTRPHIQSNFADDRIKLTQNQFNHGIDEYKKFGTNYQILNRDDQDNPTTPTMARSEVMDLCSSFIMHQH